MQGAHGVRGGRRDIIDFVLADPCAAVNGLLREDPVFSSLNGWLLRQSLRP
jgi:hypothetical protein